MDNNPKLEVKKTHLQQFISLEDLKLIDNPLREIASENDDFNIEHDQQHDQTHDRDAP